jgi:hypothetical protein
VDDTSTNRTYSAALAYAALGWAVIAVHGLSDPEHGICTCGRRNCDNVGKHPVHTGWTTGPAMSGADAYATWEEDGPDWNVGIRTGEPSGFFVLDIDPKSGGMTQLAELEAVHGRLPRTRTVSTGSGGRHYYFAMPDFGVRNNARKLAAGIDVRGTGGMVVAPPSVSGIGPYVLLDDAPIVAAPPWLLDLLVIPAGIEASLSVTAEDLPEYADLDRADQERLTRYAEAVLRSEATAYAQAPPGCGNQQLFESACSVLEIVQSPWNALGVRDAVAVLEQARRIRELQRGAGNGQDVEEFRRTFQSAQSKVVGQGRPVPPDPHDGVMFDHPMQGSAAPDDDAADPANDLGFELALSVAPPRTALERLRGRLHTRSQLEGIEPPTPLIEGVMDVGSMIVLAGQFGSFKTFATIGWACSIATGESWLGHEVVTPGTVLYVAAEGASGIKLRVRAWEHQAGVVVPDDRLYVLDIPVNLGADDQCSALLTIATEVGAKLVIFDTLHRCTPGLDGNDSSEMGRITMVADALREHVGAATLYVHHTGHAGTRSRGASSIEDDADCVWISKLTGDDSRHPDKPRALEQRKTKDSPLLEQFFVKLDLVDGTDSGALVLVDEYGVEITNAAAGADPFASAGGKMADMAEIQARIQAETNDNAGLLLNVFADTFAEHASGPTKTEVKAACKERYGSLGGWTPTGFTSTFQRAWGRLEARGVIVDNGGGRWLVTAPEERPNQP